MNVCVRACVRAYVCVCVCVWLAVQECSGNVLPVPGDIIDNDCDGKIDEEAFNGIGEFLLSPV